MTKQPEVTFTSDCPSWIRDRVNAAHVVMGADVARIGAFLESLPLLDGTDERLFRGRGYSVLFGKGDEADGSRDFVSVYSTTPLPDAKRLLSARPVASLIA